MAVLRHSAVGSVFERTHSEGKHRRADDEQAGPQAGREEAHTRSRGKHSNLS
ncbi:hypothetical protein ABVT39_027330 [Epinephelus coioides]